MFVRPPSTSITVPWTNADSSLARYTAAGAMASGAPLSPAGVPLIMCAAARSAAPSGPWGDGGRDTPGEMGVTRTPAGPQLAAPAPVPRFLFPLAGAFNPPTPD